MRVVLATLLFAILAGRIGAEEPAKTAETSPENSGVGERKRDHVLFPESESLPLRASVGEGVTFSTPDEEFLLRLHILTQGDGKLFLPGNQDPARSGIYFPRIRTYFEGRVTRSFEYEVSIQRSVEGTFDILDANINYRPCEQFQVKVGRFIVPYSYAWYDHLEQYFIAPERGLYPLNFGLSRSGGAMIWGKLAEKRVEYAFGWFSGQVAGLADTNTTRDLVGYVNTLPFKESERFPALKHFNIGGSFAIGDQQYPAEPLPLRTSLQSSENDEAAQGASAVFLDFFPGVNADGIRRQGALHAAWYVNGWSLETEWAVGDFGFLKEDGKRTVVPVSGFHITAAYFLTGEQITQRGPVEPLRPFNPVSGQRGPGAIEPFARVSQLRTGSEVFDDGLADRDNYTNKATILDLGWNWYPNKYLKFYFDWQHAGFGSPVVINRQTGTRRQSNDLLWIRAQMWF